MVRTASTSPLRCYRSKIPSEQADQHNKKPLPEENSVTELVAATDEILQLYRKESEAHRKLIRILKERAPAERDIVACLEEYGAEITAKLEGANARLAAAQIAASAADKKSKAYIKIARKLRAWTEDKLAVAENKLDETQRRLAATQVEHAITKAERTSSKELMKATEEKLEAVVRDGHEGTVERSVHCSTAGSVDLE
ncbi:hypothetical protein Q8F55_004552 [Vanrija albida]|uniref:Inhibitor of growth protein N-terminal histone-binding domain-containing protein n=1 Tax=Vanrija albida TaxID=181172 RepID=A0ABR3Q737_9TREE